MFISVEQFVAIGLPTIILMLPSSAPVDVACQCYNVRLHLVSTKCLSAVSSMSPVPYVICSHSLVGLSLVAAPFVMLNTVYNSEHDL